MIPRLRSLFDSLRKEFERYTPRLFELFLPEPEALSCLALRKVHPHCPK